MRAPRGQNQSSGEMITPDEGNSDNGKAKKPDLLPTGEQAKEIIEVLAAIYLAVYKSEDTVDDEANDEHASR
jgi:hypothetical protein